MSRADREQLRERIKGNDFSVAVRAHIRERDDERCVLCGRPGREVHHIIPRAQGGLGSADNGVCLDSTCHHQAHRSKAVERQLARYRERVLLPYYGLTQASDYLPDAVIDQLLDHQRQGLLCLRRPVNLHS
ncbi:MAG: HNH endonuclease [Tumebacillaceae bacterium]